MIKLTKEDNQGCLKLCRALIPMKLGELNKIISY